MDVARTALRRGARKVTVYSRSYEIKASQSEAELAKVDGVRFEYGLTPVEILPEGVMFHKLPPEDDSPAADDTGKECLHPAHSVIIAIGQRPKSTIVKTSKGIETDRLGLVLTGESGETTRRGVFASGDVVSGARTVVEAVEISKGVANAMDMYMREL